jgi:hypothetical protein
MSATQKTRVKRGESSNAQDGERRVETQWKELSVVAGALRQLESQGHVSSFAIICQRSDGIRTSHTSENLEGWERTEMENLLEEADCGKWLIKPSEEEEIQQSRDKFSSLAAAAAHLNLGEVRNVLRAMDFDPARKQFLAQQDVPPHMLSMLHKIGDMYFDLGEAKDKDVSDEEGHDGQKSTAHGEGTESDADERDDADDADTCKKKPKHDKHGTNGTFVQAQSLRSDEELMRFASWEQIEGTDSHEIDDKRYLSLDTLLNLKETKIFLLTRSRALIALRWLLEF